MQVTGSNDGIISAVQGRLQGGLWRAKRDDVIVQRQTMHDNVDNALTWRDTVYIRGAPSAAPAHHVK